MVGGEGMETFQRSSGTVTPVPDPTALTTAQLYREISLLEDKLDTSVEHLRELAIARIAKIERELELLEQRRVELKTDTRQALDAALASSKEAIRERDEATEKASLKAERVMLEGLKQLRTQFDTKYDSIDNQMGDAKARISRVEDIKTGNKEAKDNTTNIIGLILTLLVIADLIYTFAVLR